MIATSIGMPMPKATAIVDVSAKRKFGLHLVEFRHGLLDQ